MKQILLSFLFFCCSNLIAIGQTYQNILVGNVVIDTPIQNPDIFGRLRSTIAQSFPYMGCSNLRVRQSFRTSAKSSDDELLFVHEVEKILTYCYMNRLELDQTSEVDQQKINKFRDKYRINFVTFGQLSYDPISSNQEYRLQFAIMEAESWNIILEKIVSFSRYEIIKPDFVRNKITEILLEESEKLGCKPKIFEDYWGAVKESAPTQIAVLPSTVKAKHDTNPNIPTSGNADMENLEKALRQFVWLEWVYPYDKDLKRINEKYKQNAVLYKKYLAQKVLFFQDQYNAQMEEHIGEKNMPSIVKGTLNTLVNTLQELIPRIENEEQKQFLQRMLKEYSDQKSQIDNQK